MLTISDFFCAEVMQCTVIIQPLLSYCLCVCVFAVAAVRGAPDLAALRIGPPHARRRLAGHLHARAQPLRVQHGAGAVGTHQHSLRLRSAQGTGLPILSGTD